MLHVAFAENLLFFLSTKGWPFVLCVREEQRGGGGRGGGVGGGGPKHGRAFYFSGPCRMTVHGLVHTNIYTDRRRVYLSIRGRL